MILVSLSTQMILHGIIPLDLAWYNLLKYSCGEEIFSVNMSNDTLMTNFMSQLFDI